MTNPRHTNVIIELALLDNRQSRQTSMMELQARNLDPLDFAKRFASVHVNLGRAAGHTGYAVRQWLNGAVLVVPTLSDVSRLVKQHQATAQQAERLFHLGRWFSRSCCLLGLKYDSDLIVFDKGSEIVLEQKAFHSGRPLQWPARERNDLTYLFLG